MSSGRHPIRRWLAAERDGRDRDAERALVATFRCLALPQVSPRFTRSVLERIALPAPPPLAVGWRAAIAALLVIVSVSVVYSPWVVLVLRSVIGLGSLVDFVAGTTVQLSRAIVSWSSLWQTVGEVHQVLLSLLSRPVVAVFVLATTGLAAVALRLLTGLMSADRSRSYV